MILFNWIFNWKGYEVWGILKSNSVTENQTAWINNEIFLKLKLEYADLTDLESLIRVTQKYNLMIFII